MLDSTSQDSSAPPGDFVQGTADARRVVNTAPADPWYVGVNRKAGDFIADLTNPMTMFGTFALAMSATFIAVGHYLEYRVHNPLIAFWFFIPPVVLMAAFAWAYGAWATSQKNFDGGLLSARSVIRGIYYMVSISFATAGYELLQPNWQEYPDSTYPMLCLWVGPVLMIIFAVAYGLYAQNCTVDLRPGPALLAGSGRRSMRLMTLVTMGVFMYNVILAARSLDAVAIWISLASFAGSFIICFGTTFVYTNCVDLQNDRGVNLS